MVERHLAKVNVAGSNLVSRSKISVLFFLSFFVVRQRWRYSQVVRPRSAKPLSPGSNPGGASKKLCTFTGAEFLLSDYEKHHAAVMELADAKDLKFSNTPFPTKIMHIYAKTS